MILLEDYGQKIDQHKIKNEYWKSNGINVIRIPIPTGDYCLLNEKSLDVIERKKKRNVDVKKMDLLGTFNISVDTKRDLPELYQDLIQSHDRFRDELLLAYNNGIKLYILTENEIGVSKKEDVIYWKNPRWYIWKNNTRKIFIDLQKEFYSESNAINFFNKRNYDVPIKSEQIKKEYFKKLKEIDIEEIFEYLKSKKVSKYLKDKDIQLRKKPASNESIIKKMETMEEKYGVEFLFCTKEECGKKIINLLTEKKEV